MVEHIIRYGTPADSKFLVDELIETYDTIALNGNMLAHAPDALSNFLTHRAAYKPFFIDPQTHAFQHDLEFIESSSSTVDKPKIKTSIEKLLKQYGSPAEEIILEKHRSLRPNDFRQTGVEQFTTKVLEFQKNLLGQKVQKSDYYKYLNYKQLKSDDFSPVHPAPKWLVAPYFFLEEAEWSQWLEINRRCAEHASDQAKNMGIPLAIQITLSKECLNDTNIVKKIIEGYRNLKGVDRYLLWIDDLPENEVGKATLEKTTKLISQLSETAPVINLYGGFFSVAVARWLLKDRLVGVCHGLEYGESRAVVPVGGGLPVAKYYFPNAFRRFSFRGAVRAVSLVGGDKNRGAFFRHVCGCKQCKEVITSDVRDSFFKYGESWAKTFTRNGKTLVREFPYTETKHRSVLHYLYCKHREYTEDLKLDDVLNIFDKTYDVLSPSMADSVKHLPGWSSILANNK